MKNSFLYLAFIIALGLGGAAEAMSTTFSFWDKMTPAQQGDLLADRLKKIHDWLEANDPAKAQCMIEKFKLKEGEEYTDTLLELNKQIQAVPEKDRHLYHVETLMVNFITVNLCGDFSSKPTPRPHNDATGK